MAYPHRVALVTGASSGIGAAVASQLAAKGIQVFGTSRTPDTADPTRGIEFISLDVTDPASVRSAVSLLINKAGRIDILVNNAGVTLLGAGEESSDAQVLELFETNFFGLVRLTREVLPHLRRQRSGRIINIGSVLGFLPAPYAAYYSASKHAIEGYSESLDHETRDFGVRASVIEPAFTKTSISTHSIVGDLPLDVYDAPRQGAQQLLDESIATGDDPAVVARVVVKAALSRNPRLRYPAGPAAHRLALLKKFAPTRLLDKGIRRANRLTSRPTHTGAQPQAKHDLVTDAESRLHS